MIGENLTWIYHIERVCSKVSKRIGIKYKSINILSKRVIKQFYFSVAQPLQLRNIAYASPNKSNLIFLYCHHKNVTRIIYEKDSFAHTKPLFKHENTLTLSEINLFYISSLIIKCKSWTALFVFHYPYTLKHPSKYCLRKYNRGNLAWLFLKFGCFSIYFRDSYLWNKIIAKKNFHL